MLRLIAFLFSLSASTCIAAPVGKPSLPDIAPIELEPIGKFGPGASIENSGIVRSRFRDDLFWTINDSGDAPKVYPVFSDGSLWGSARYSDDPGVMIGGAINVDWEDIAVDDLGNLIVCDVGNNRNDRRDLTLYYLPEPSPLAGRTTYQKKIFLKYPDQALYPADQSDFNYDCEGVFCVRDKVYLVSKNRSNTLGKLYRLDSVNPQEMNTLTYVDAFDFGGKTTAADASIDGRRLAVTTYDALWVFEIDGATDMYFRGRIYWMPFIATQVEAVCFDGRDTILLADEADAEIYKVEFEELTRVDQLELAPID